MISCFFSTLLPGPDFVNKLNTQMLQHLWASGVSFIVSFLCEIERKAGTDTWEALYGTLTSDQVKVLLTKGFRNRLAQCPFKKKKQPLWFIYRLRLRLLGLHRLKMEHTNDWRWKQQPVKRFYVCKQQQQKCSSRGLKADASVGTLCWSRITSSVEVLWLFLDLFINNIRPVSHNLIKIKVKK